LVLELLEYGLLNFKNGWDFEMISRGIAGFGKSVIGDFISKG
jgi:hypothetical protein